MIVKARIKINQLDEEIVSLLMTEGVRLNLSRRPLYY